MSVSGQRICALAEEAAAAAEPEVALETLTRIREELQEFERQQVARALTAGRTYGDVAPGDTVEVQLDPLGLLTVSFA